MSRKAPADSLDLLLDTICNTFGGVLFIAILVCLLLRSTASERADTPLPQMHEIAEQQSRLDRLRAHLESLQQAARHQEDLFSQFSDPELSSLLQHRRKLEDMRQDLLNATRIVEKQLGRQQTAVAETQQKQTSLRQDLESARREAKAALETLAAETAARTETARLPILRSSFKQEVAFVVRYGRLYLLRTYDGQGVRGGLNTSEFTILDQGEGEVTATPKPYAGEPLGPMSLHAITELVSRFNSSRFFIAIAVWDDSFESFQQFKRILVNRGYEYKLLPMADGDVISESGGDKSVQ